MRFQPEHNCCSNEYSLTAFALQNINTQFEQYCSTNVYIYMRNVVTVSSMMARLVYEIACVRVKLSEADRGEIWWEPGESKGRARKRLVTQVRITLSGKKGSLSVRSKNNHNKKQRKHIYYILYIYSIVIVNYYYIALV